MKRISLVFIIVFWNSISFANIRLVLNGGGAAEMMAMHAAESLPKILQLAATDPFLFGLNRTDQLNLNNLLRYLDMNQKLEGGIEQISLSGSDLYDFNHLPKSQAKILEILLERLFQKILEDSRSIEAKTPGTLKPQIVKQILGWEENGIYQSQVKHLVTCLFRETSPSVEVFQDSKVSVEPSDHGAKVTVLKVKGKVEIYLQMNGLEKRTTPDIIAAINDLALGTEITKIVELRGVRMLERRSTVLALRIAAQTATGQSLLATVGLHPKAEWIGFSTSIAVAGLTVVNRKGEVVQCSESMIPEKKEN